MKPSSWNKQLGLASPRESAAIQNGKTKTPSKKETGLDASHTHVSRRGQGEEFFLDILFYRMSDIGMLQRLPGRWSVYDNYGNGVNTTRVIMLV
jgi:hypothetical protein